MYKTDLSKKHTCTHTYTHIMLIRGLIIELLFIFIFWVILPMEGSQHI